MMNHSTNYSPKYQILTDEGKLGLLHYQLKQYGKAYQLRMVEPETN